ncbi:MAG: DNA cytosine methyltransferase [Planctomycetota bacterium]
MDNPSEITVLSLCAGYGGIELGLSRALANPLRVVAVEIEAYALANLEAKAAQGALAVEALWPDLRTFPAERFRGCFDFVTAGYPCQGESIAGKQLSDKDPRWLWPHIRRIIAAVEPVWFFGENVANHVNLGYPTVYGSLRDMGYAVEAGLFTAAECGAPHRRQRLFILAEHAGRGRGELRGTQQPQHSRFSESGGDVADAERPRSRPGTGQEPPTRERRRGLAERGAVVADAWQQRMEGNGAGRQQEPPAHAGQEIPLRCCDRWPAPPGQPQHEWEEPRVIVAKSKRAGARSQSGAAGRGSGQSDVRQGDGASGTARTNATSGEAVPNAERTQRRQAEESESAGIGRAEPGTQRAVTGQAQPRLGGATDGTACRVDRLRLLGNGVVPAQAELAFRELMKAYNI